MTGDPLIPHLMDIIVRPELHGLVLAGGFGIRVKQDHLARTEAITLIAPFPPARATGDFDLFLHMEIFGDPERQEAMRRAIDELGYSVKSFNWQFQKPLGEAFPNRKVKLDLLSRRPLEGEDVKLRTLRIKGVPPPRPLKVGDGLLHGRDTHEAFAIEHDPIVVPVVGRTSEGETIEREVLVPHPYAFLNMKVRAAHDWLRMTRGEIEHKPYADKHAFDVYVLVAMLVAGEIARAQELAAAFADHPVAAAIRGEAHELFGASNSPGTVEARRQTNGAFEFEPFREALSLALGMEPA